MNAEQSMGHGRSTDDASAIVPGRPPGVTGPTNPPRGRQDQVARDKTRRDAETGQPGHDEPRTRPKSPGTP